jgi:WD40 repeat protein
VSAQILSPENNSLVNAIAFSPNGSIIATGENKEYLWNSVTRKLIASLSDPGGGHVASAAFSPGGNTIATLDGNGYVYIWDVATHSLIRKIPVFTNGDPGSTVVYSPNGRLLAVATGDPLEVSGILSGSETSNIEFLSVPEYQPVGNVEDPGNPDGVWSMAFSPDGKILAAGDGNGTTYLWNTQNSTLVGTVSDPSSVGVRAVTFSHDGKMLATGDMNGNSYTWRIPGYKLAATLSLPGASASSASVVSVFFSPDGQTLATASDLGVTDLWDSGQFNP